MTVAVSTNELGAYIEVLRKDLPQHMHTVKRVALLRIGKETIKELRKTGLTKFKKNGGKRVGNTFKRQTLANDSILSIYSKWKGAGIHESGGTITAKGKMLWIWMPGGKKKDGSRKYTDAQIEAEISSGQMFFLKRPGRPTLVLRNIGKKKKNGEWSAGTRTELVAVLRRSVRLQSRYSLLDAHTRAAPAHAKVSMQTLDEVIDSSKLVDQ